MSTVRDCRAAKSHAEHARLKYGLAGQFRKDRDAYKWAKTAFVENIPILLAALGNGWWRRMSMFRHSVGRDGACARNAGSMRGLTCRCRWSCCLGAALSLWSVTIRPSLTGCYLGTRP